MNCHDFERWIALDVGGDLPEGDRPTLQVHLQSCPRCRLFADEMHESRQSLRALHREPLDVAQLQAVRASVVERLEAEAGTRRGRFVWWLGLRPNWARFAVLAAGFVVAVGLAWWYTGTRPPGGVVASQGIENQPGLAAVPDSPATQPAPEPDDTGAPPSNDIQVQAAVAGVAEVSVLQPRPGVVEATDPMPATQGQPQTEPVQQETEEPVVPPERPRYELVTVPVSNPEGGESEQYLLRVASDNPNIEIYWMFDENGG